MAEITERINRHRLVRLLDTMTPVDRQAITHRTRISDLDAALPMARPPAYVAALLPPVKPVRAPRATVVTLRRAPAKAAAADAHERETVAAPPLERPAPVVAKDLERPQVAKPLSATRPGDARVIAELAAFVAAAVIILLVLAIHAMR
jgi:hypothetical protein